jgi:hypothetical protein
MRAYHWLVVAGVALALALPVAAQVPGKMDRWWPTFPLPQRIYTVDDHGPYARQIAAETLSGLLALHDRIRGAGPMIWLDQHNPDYARWLKLFLIHHHVPMVRKPTSLWNLIRRFHNLGIVRGYVLYSHRSHRGRRDLSVNWATSLCAPLQAIAVDSSLQVRARRAGLPMLADARGKSFQWLLSKMCGRYSRRQLCILHPAQTNARDEAVAAGALVTLDVPGGGYLRALGFMRPGGIVFGWGVSEFGSVHAASVDALRVDAMDWASNVPLLSSGSSGLSYKFPGPVRSKTSPVYSGHRHYLSFLISDGDNVQWAMGGYCTDPNGWASPQRGTVPFGWSLPLIDLAQINPYEISWLQKHAGRNDELLQFGLGYFYLDDYGKARGGTTALKELLESVRPYIAKLHVHVLLLFTNHWDSPAAIRGYRLVAHELPMVQGVLAIQYSPYAAGKGKILWVKHADGVPMPIISSRTFLWNQGKGHNSAFFQRPNYAAGELNTWAAHGPTAAAASQFAWVGVHAWSNFNFGKPSQSVGQYGAAVYTAKRLNPGITLVTPGQLVKLLLARAMKGGNP